MILDVLIHLQSYRPLPPNSATLPSPQVPLRHHCQGREGSAIICAGIEATPLGWLILEISTLFSCAPTH